MDLIHECAGLVVRSCTDCYLDLADFAVPVTDGGTLVHFLSDSQWVLHWLLYRGPDGGEAVVVTEHPLGFERGPDADEETVRVFEPAAGQAAVCADSFAEFLYRFWIENGTWFKLTHPDARVRVLSDEQRRYAEHYALRDPLHRRDVPAEPTEGAGPDQRRAQEHETEHTTRPPG